MSEEKKQRTTRQNKSLHLFFTELANELTNKGLDMKTVLKPEVDIMWTPELVKEYIWRPIQKAVVQKESTTELTTGELDQVFRVIEKHLGEKFGLEIVFPSQATLADKHSPWNAQDTSQ